MLKQDGFFPGAIEQVYVTYRLAVLQVIAESFSSGPSSQNAHINLVL